tara:strand:- start:700 stop:966 length:267 start_codon:yes stop_codon:yes gene_type:complete
MNCGLLCDVITFIKNIFKFIYETLSLKNRPIIFICILAVMFMLMLIKTKPKFLYDILSPFYDNKNKEGFSFENLQKIMREESDKDKGL